MTEKYRAKQKEDGEWWYGCYVPPAYHSKDDGTPGIEHMILQDEDWAVAIDPYTLSRCSGLTACGQEVYEGDIVRFHSDHTTELWTAVVRFGWHDTYEYGWYLEPIRDTVFTRRIGAWLGENPAFGSTAAVVGNVWDDPEMMEGKV